MAYKLFRGVEVEGEYAGLRTLFVEGPAPIEVVEASIKVRDCRYEQVYFGAKYSTFALQPSKSDLIAVYKIAHTYTQVIVTLETSTVRDLCNLMLFARANFRVVFAVHSAKTMLRVITAAPSAHLRKIQFKLFTPDGVMLFPALAVSVTRPTSYTTDILLREENT